MSDANLYLIVFCAVFGAFFLALAAYFICNLIATVYEERKVAPLYHALINLQCEVEKLRNEVRQYKAELETHTHDAQSDESTTNSN